jgi:hypothetical protein
MDFPDTRTAQWFVHCPAYAAIADSGTIEVPEVIYERSLAFTMARYMTLTVKRREHSLPLLTRLMKVLMKRQPQQMVSKALRALDGLTYTVGKILFNAGQERKKVAGFNLPMLYVADGYPIHLNIDLMMSEAPMRKTGRQKYGVRVIIYHFDPDSEPGKIWLLYNPRVMGAVCLASDLQKSYAVAVDIASPYRRTVYRLDLKGDYTHECREQIHRIGRQMSYGLLGKNATKQCLLCPCRRVCEQGGTAGEINVRTISEVSR